MQHKPFWWGASLVMALFMGALLVGFDANPAPQPQRVSDLVARIEDLEQENVAQQELLDAISARLDALETSGGVTRAIILDRDVTIPREWVQSTSSDGIMRYRYDPAWEVATDEPGSLDLWLDEDSALFFTWDWSAGLLDDLHADEEYFRFFEKDLVWSDETTKMNVVESNTLEFMGDEAHYWDIRVESTDGYKSRMLTIFYPCSDRASCNLTFVRVAEDARNREGVAEFSREDWAFVHTFAHGVQFLTEGKATVTSNANLRACAATTCEVVGRLVRGEIVDVVAMSEDGQWLQLKSGEWVAADLVFGAPLDLPVVRDNDDI